jgi:hypothetical protein
MDADRSANGVPFARRFTGTLYAAPPWLHMAGLMAVRRGRPATSLRSARGMAAGDGLAAAMAEVDALLANMDQILVQP